MKRRLALFLDGTWNDPKDATNVSQLAAAVADASHGSANQLVLYLPGVGTPWYQHITGGVMGRGLSENVLKAYAWLVKNYNEGDDIFLFGFSRGAYTARSVAGVIILCGLLRHGHTMTCEEIYGRYQAGKGKLPLHQIDYLLRHPDHPQHGSITEEDRVLHQAARRVPIRFLGVWDTVGALGIPWNEAPLIGRGNFYFHNTNLSVLIESASHALAIDENRAPYKPTLWNWYAADGATPKQKPGADQVEQRWFVGAHANVGGGYGPTDALATVPLAWLQMRAATAGLKFHQVLEPSSEAAACPVRDSYGEFMKGFYKVLRLGMRFYRDIGRGPYKVRGGTATPVNEVIDATVFKRYQDDRKYRPRNLKAACKRARIDPATHQGELRF